MNRREWLKAAGLALVLPGAAGKAATAKASQRCEVCGEEILGWWWDNKMQRLFPVCKNHPWYKEYICPAPSAITKHRILAQEMARTNQPC